MIHFVCLVNLVVLVDLFVLVDIVDLVDLAELVDIVDLVDLVDFFDCIGFIDLVDQAKARAKFSNLLPCCIFGPAHFGRNGAQKFGAQLPVSP